MSTCARFVGKVALVTASTKGIGFAIAKKLGEEGASIIVSSRKKANVELAVEKLKNQGLNAEGFVCHIGNANDRRCLFQKVKDFYGGLDILVSNAAVNTSYGDILDKSDFAEFHDHFCLELSFILDIEPNLVDLTNFQTTSESWDKIFGINVKSTFLLCKEALPLLECKGGGSIIIVSSVAGYAPLEMLGAYSVSKTSLIGLVKSLMYACAKRNIRINGIAPGVITTDFSSALWMSENAEKFLSQIPMKRFGKPDECAGVVAFLASEDASYITGEIIVVSGGSISRL